MPSRQRRIGVLLSPEHYELIGRVAAHQKTSRSAVLRELFETVAPVFVRIDQLVVAAKRASDSVKAGLQQTAEEAERELTPVFAKALGVFDQMQAQLEEVEANGRAARGARGAAGAPRPPHANQGGQVLTRKPKFPARRKSRP